MPWIFMWTCLSFFISGMSVDAPVMKFQLRFGDADLSLDKAYALAPGEDSIEVSIFRMYISNVNLFHRGKKVYQLKKVHHLLDASRPETMHISLEKDLPFDAVSFDIGIDSLTHVRADFKGDLDPIHGMYWTWQSGFINWKIEGHSMLCPTRQHRFQWHVGGFQSPWKTQQTVKLGVTGDQRAVAVTMDLKPLFEPDRLQDKPEVMSPGSVAAAMAHQLISGISIGHEKP